MFVHVAAMTGQKELLLASWFNMEDPGYGADRQSFKLSVEILTPSIKGTKTGRVLGTGAGLESKGCGTESLAHGTLPYRQTEARACCLSAFRITELGHSSHHRQGGFLTQKNIVGI